MARREEVSLCVSKRIFIAGDHKLTFEVEPLTSTEEKPMAIYIRLIEVRVQGPMDPKNWTRPANYDRFWPRGEPGRTTHDRRRYVQDMLRGFATRAFRRPVDDRTLERLVAIAQQIYQQPGRRFEEGVARSMVAVLASPSFVFRVEDTEPVGKGHIPAQSPLDEYALASRLSYFLWSTMPDEELFRLAERHELRKNLAAQVKRMRWTRGPSRLPGTSWGNGSRCATSRESLSIRRLSSARREALR